MRISDWSSDVCSSDLHEVIRRVGGCAALDRARQDRGRAVTGYIRGSAPEDGRDRRACADERRSGQSCGSVFRSEEHTSELQSLMRISYAVFCLKKKKINLQLLIIHNINQ